jgi:hypothetical protein
MDFNIIIDALTKALTRKDFKLEQLSWYNLYIHYFRLKVYGNEEVLNEFLELVKSKRACNKLKKFDGFESIRVKLDSRYEIFKVEKIDNESFWFYLNIDRREAGKSKILALKELCFDSRKYEFIKTYFEPSEERKLLNDTTDKWLHYYASVKITKAIYQMTIEDIIYHYGLLYFDMLCKALVPFELDDARAFRIHKEYNQDNYFKYDYDTHNVSFFYKERNPFWVEK